MRHCPALLAACALAACSPSEDPDQPGSAPPRALEEQSPETDPEPSSQIARAEEPVVSGEAVPDEPRPAAEAPPSEPLVDPAVPVHAHAAGCAAEVNRAIMARSIVDREPADTQGPFDANGDSLYIFAEFNNATQADQEYELRWHHDGTDAVFTQTMTAGISPTWRTWARHRIAPQQSGQWRVEVVSPAGCVATTVEFQAQ